MLGVAFPVQLFLSHLLQVTIHPCPESKPRKLFGTQGELWWSHISFCSWDLGKWGLAQFQSPLFPGQRESAADTHQIFPLFFSYLWLQLYCFPYQLTQTFAFDAAFF